MAVYKRDIVDINLETGNIHRSFLKHSIGYKDQKADHFGIRTYRDGVPVDLTGVSVQGIFLPPQGDPIAITSGNIVDGNVAEVVLPQACYNYDGQFTLSIKLVDSNNSVTGTMRIVDGMVDNTHASGTVAPTAAVPTYQEILSSYDAMVAATTAANTAATNCASIVAAAYSTSATYAVGDYCTKDGKLYRCTTAITTAESWTAAHWTQTKMGPDVSDLKSALNAVYKSNSVTADSNQQTKFIEMNFISGRKYTVKNISTGYTTCNTKNQATTQASVVQSVGTIAPNATISFTASSDAVYLSCYFGIAGTVIVIDEDTVLSKALKDIDDIESDIDDINSDITDTNNHIDAVDDSFNSFKETGADFFIGSHSSLFAVGYIYLSTGAYDANIKYSVATPDKFTCDSVTADEYTVGNGYSVAVLSYTGDTFTYVAYTAGQTFKLESGKQYKIRITEDPTDTSVVFTSPADVLPSIFKYAPIIEKLMGDSGSVYHVEKDGSGDFDSLVEAINTATQEMNATVYVGAGTWDIVGELGAAYMAAVSSSSSTWGLVLKNGIHVIGTSKTLITAKYSSQSPNATNVKKYFSAFNAGTKGFTLENLTIETDYTRYTVHDDLGGAGSTPFHNKYINCVMKHTNGEYTLCIGGGLGVNGTYEIEGCTFEGDSGATGLAYYHGNNASGETTAQCKIIVKDCYFKGSGTFGMTKYGDSPLMTTAYVSNNSFGSEPYVNSGSYAPYNNVEIVGWNNVVRS